MVLKYAWIYSSISLFSRWVIWSLLNTRVPLSENWHTLKRFDSASWKFWISLLSPARRNSSQISEKPFQVFLLFRKIPSMAPQMSAIGVRIQNIRRRVSAISRYPWWWFSSRRVSQIDVVLYFKVCFRGVEGRYTEFVNNGHAQYSCFHGKLGCWWVRTEFILELISVFMSNNPTGEIYLSGLAIKLHIEHVVRRKHICCSV